MEFFEASLIERRMEGWEGERERRKGLLLFDCFENSIGSDRSTVSLEGW